ncbi:MAG: DsbA family protein [Acetobacteraceae bacterium]
MLAVLFPAVTPALCAASLYGLTPVVEAKAESFDAGERTEIVRILRDALKTDPTILQEALETYATDARQRRAQAMRQAIATRRDMIFSKNDPSAGPPDAPVTVVEFFDTNCGYCRQVEPMLSSWLRNGPGLRIIYKDMPILGPSSSLGSRALLAAQRQGAYQRLRDAMMHSPPNLNEASLQTIVSDLGLDWNRLQADMADPTIQQRLDDNVRLGQDLGISGTPAFVVGDRLVLGSDMAQLQAAIMESRRR